MILLGSNHYSSPAASFNTHSIDLERDSNQYLSIADASQTGLDITGDFTFELWANFESNINGVFINKRGSAGNYSYNFYYTATNNIVLFLSNNGTSFVSKLWSFTPTLSTWYHIAVTFDSSAGSAQLFINGVTKGTVTGLPNSIYNSNVAFVIGSNPTVGNYQFDGLIDDVRIWNDVRTSTEIANNMNKELTGTEANLQGYWKLNNSPNDLTSNGNDLTETNSPIYSTDTPF